MPKKTLKVEIFLDDMNSFLKNSTCEPSVRHGMIFALEHALFKTGNYKGFKYLTPKDVAPDALPGVRYDDCGNVLDYERRFENTDDTRRHYY